MSGTPSLPEIGLRTRLLRTFDLLRGTAINIDEYDSNTHDDLVNFDGIEGEEELERYWVNPPYAMVVITYNPEEHQNYYYAIEPELNDIEQRILTSMSEDIRDSLIYTETKDSDNPIKDQMETLLREYGVSIGTVSFEKVYYYLWKAYKGYGRIDPIMHDTHVEDISCDGYNIPIFVYHDKYDDIETNITYEEEELDSFVTRTAQRSGRHISIGDPSVEATLPDGSRGELMLGEEITPRGSAFTIRKYSDDPFTPVDLINYGTFDIEQMAYLWLAIENNKSLIFAGGTASGKTTSMNAISMFIPPRAKVLSIEDTRELALYHDNWLSSITRDRVTEGSDITMYDLLRSALRHRPEYIIVGEVRGKEAMTLFQAMNTGHTTYSTMHADSVQTVINRLENDPINVPRAMIQSLDILCVQRLTKTGGERVRRNATLSEIHSVDQRTGDLDYTALYEWQPEDDSFRGQTKNSSLMKEIQDDLGLSRTELLRELKQRQKVLKHLTEKDISDYKEFTSVINEYYSAPDNVLDFIDSDEHDVTAITD